MFLKTELPEADKRRAVSFAIDNLSIYHYT